MTILRDATTINDGTTAIMAVSLRNHGDNGGATVVYAVQAPQWYRASGVTGVLDAKRIKSQQEKNELRSVLEWHPAANDVGELCSSPKPINSTLPAFESTVFLYLLG